MAGETVLIVDNDEDFLTITVEMLQQAGFRVHTARDGDEGLERASELEAALEDRERQRAALAAEVQGLKRRLSERISRHKLYNRYLSIFVALVTTGLMVLGFRGNPPWWALALVIVITIILNVPLEAATELFVRHGKGEAGVKLDGPSVGRDDQQPT